MKNKWHQLAHGLQTIPIPLWIRYSPQQLWHWSVFSISQRLLSTVVKSPVSRTKIPGLRYLALPIVSYTRMILGKSLSRCSLIVLSNMELRFFLTSEGSFGL